MVYLAKQTALIEGALENMGFSSSQAAQLLYPVMVKDSYWNFNGPYAGELQFISTEAQSANQSFSNWFILGVIGAIAVTLLLIFIL